MAHSRGLDRTAVIAAAAALADAEGLETLTLGALAEKLGIRTPSINALCLNLSGGNQQKVVLAKWLNAEARILILDHPTRGLDVGAKEEVYELVRDLSAQGVAILLISDTLEETIGLSHQVLGGWQSASAPQLVRQPLEKQA